jgi:hypothetical protein
MQPLPFLYQAPKKAHHSVLPPPPANPYQPFVPTIPTVDNFTGGGASIVEEIILPRNVEFVAQPIDQVTEESPLENATTAVDRMSINPTTNDPIDIATDSPEIGLHEFNISVSINHPTVDTCIDEINFTSNSQENKVFNNVGLFGNITDIITANARQPRKRRAIATITTSTRDLWASLHHVNPPSSNRGLKNSSVLCYLNSYFQVLASYRDLPDCLSQPPSDDDRHFPIYYKLATPISLIRSGQGDPVCTKSFTRLFRDNFPDFNEGQRKLSFIIIKLSYFSFSCKVG